MAFRAPQPNRFRRTKCVTAMLAFTWVGHGIYERLTTPAMTLEQAYARYGPVPDCDCDSNATELLRSAIAALPRPKFDELAPHATYWAFNSFNDPFVDYGLDDLMRGPWTPEARPYLRACRRYLASEVVETAMHRLHSLRGSRLCTSDPQSAWFNPSDTTMIPIGQLYQLLMARLRCALETGNFTSAREDLKSLFWLADGLPFVRSSDGVGFPGYVEFASLAEIMRAVQAHPVPEIVLLEWQYLVESLPDPNELQSASLAARRIRAQCLAARRFANTGDGNGWLMLSESYSHRTRRRSVLWNLLSFPYHRHAVVEAKIAVLYAEIEEAVKQPYGLANADIDRLAMTMTFTALDGEPLINGASANQLIQIAQGAYERIAIMRACRAGTLTTIALARYRNTYGQYPAAIAELVPEFIPAVPVDLYCNGPMHYVREFNGFRLWVCGADGVDNGGQSIRGADGYAHRHFDLLLPDKREPYYSYSELAPLPPLQHELGEKPSLLEGL